MTELFLSELNLDKIKDISDLCDRFDMKSGVQSLVPDAWANQYDPNVWQGSGNRQHVGVRVYMVGYPLAIITPYRGIDITRDPEFGLIKAVVQLVECRFVCGSGGERYQDTLFQ